MSDNLIKPRVFGFHILVLFYVFADVIAARIISATPIIYTCPFKRREDSVRFKEPCKLIAGNLKLVVTEVLNSGHNDIPFVRSFNSSGGITTRFT